MHELPAWVTEAASLPLAFAQVREDPLVDQGVVEQLGAEARVIMVASGGCNAAYLATLPNVASLHLVDPNPAQMALTRLKLQLLATTPLADRLANLGHAVLAPNTRERWVKSALAALGLAHNALGPTSLVATLGPDYAGRYERVFAELARALDDVSDEIDALLRLEYTAEQTRRVTPASELGKRLDEAFDTVLALPNLVRLFGEEATRNPVDSFARHFAQRIRQVLATLPAARNPYLWQMLKGCYPDGQPVPWLMQPCPVRLPVVTWSIAFMAETLQTLPASSDFVHLSNILDWLTPAKAQATLELACAALRPGGWTLVRQLNSTLDVPSLGPGFDWHTATANALHARDRSFFYRALHLGRKR